jgi:phage antirepressor YoqD-like protein
MNELANRNDSRMTVKEVAEILGVTDEAIKKHVRELYPDLMRNGVATYLNEEQVTAIKQKMLPTTSVVGAITDLEAAEMLLKSAEHFKARFEQEHGARVEAEQRLAIAAPKAEFYDQVAGSNDAIQMRDVAAVLNIPGMGRNTIFYHLRRLKILDSRNIPYRQYQDKGYFRVIEQSYDDAYGETHINFKTLVYQTGVDFIRKLLRRITAALPQTSTATAMNSDPLF